MSINYKELRTNLIFIVNSLTGEKVIWQNQNSNTPDGEFLSMKITSMRKIGGTDWEGKPVEVDATFFSPTQGDREFILNIQAISQDSMEILLDLIDKLDLNTTIELLNSKKIAYVGLDGDIADITVQIDNSFETRASAELLFRISKNYTANTVNEVEIVESIGIEGEFNNDTPNPLDIDLIVSI